METLLQDLRVGLRQLLKDRVFSLTAILTLTLGIGATAAMFTVVDALFLTGLPYPQPERLVILTGTLKGQDEVAISQSDLADWRRRASDFSALSVYGKLAFNLEQGQQSQRLWGELVDESYFGMLGLHPALGRFFTAEEDARPMEQYVAVLGWNLWRQSFGGDPQVVGRDLQLNGRTYRVVGVAPQGFRGLTDAADLFVPSMVPPVREFLTVRRLRWANAVARLGPGVTLAQAQQQMTAVTASLAAELPNDDRGIGATVTPLREHWFGKLRGSLALLSLGAGAILLIACINVASLLLTRAVAKQRAFAIRVAIGARRGRLVRQLLTESVLLSLLGAVCGLVAAAWATHGLVAASGVSFPSFVHVGVGPRVVAGVVGLAVACGLAFGLAPVAISFRPDLTRSLGRDEKLAPKAKGFHRFQNAVVVAQVALALALSVDAGLMAKGFSRMMHQDLGFKPQNLLSFRIDLRGPRFVSEAFDTRLLREEYLRRMSAVPGVRQLAMADPTIPTDELAAGYIAIEDHDSDSPDGTYIAMMHAVTPDYFAILGIPLAKGRAFTRDDTQSNAVVVSKALADQQWPGKDPIGRRLKLDSRANQAAPWLTVVGVAAEVRHEGLQGERAPAPDVYLSLFQFIRRPPLTVNFLVRPDPGIAAARLMPALHREIMAIDPELPDYDAATMQDRLLRQTDKARFELVLIAIFTVLALILAAIGIYGVVAYSVAQRRREIAIRMSLGADRGSILTLVVARGARLAALGLAIGLAVVAATSGLLRDQLYQVSVADPLILGGTMLVLFLVTLAANYLPARRAATVDPMAGLRLQ
jgi:putative ABC transport system permease protein